MSIKIIYIPDFIKKYLQENNNTDWIKINGRLGAWRYKDSGYIIDAGTEWADFFYDHPSDVILPTEEPGYKWYYNYTETFDEVVLFLNNPSNFIMELHNKEINKTLDNLD